MCHTVVPKTYLPGSQTEQEATCMWCVNMGTSRANMVELAGGIFELKPEGSEEARVGTVS